MAKKSEPWKSNYRAMEIELPSHENRITKARKKFRHYSCSALRQVWESFSNFAPEKLLQRKKMKYKRKFTDEEIQDLIEWMERNLENLPQSLQFNKATFIPDLKDTVVKYIDLVHQHKDDPAFNGQIFQLFVMRDLLIKQGLKE